MPATKHSHIIKKIVTGSLLTLLVSMQVKAQDNFNAIPVLFGQYQQQGIKEKIYAHTDKSFYTAGEIIWFKLYNVDASFHKPLSLSKVAYIELMGANNKALLQAKIKLEQGRGHGSLYIPLTANSGNYKLRAYTNWMKNDGADYFFEKNITIVNTQKIAAIEPSVAAEKIDVNFFPEGGNLVNNIKSRLAFKAINEDGHEAEFKGAVTDNGDTIIRFAPLHNGMGSFYFTPQSNHTYKAYIKPAKGGMQVKELPQVYSSGFVMHLDDVGDKLHIEVKSDNLSLQEVYLFVHTRGIIKSGLVSSMQNGNVVFTINKAVLGDGISHVTVFNNKRQPVCERLYFKRPVSNLGLSAKTELPVYSTRRKVNIEIAGQSMKAKDTASISMAVYRIDSLQSTEDNFIENYLLLTSDLKGKIEDPASYFSTQDNEALDNLMLTQGWRRFKWENVLNQSKPMFVFAPEYNGHLITGTVLDMQTGKPKSDIATYLSVPGLFTEFTTATSDTNGQVRYEMKKFNGSQQIMVQPSVKYKGLYRIDIKSPFSNDFSSDSLPSFSLPQRSAATLLEHSMSMQVQNIYAGDLLNQFHIPFTDTSAFYLKPDARYMLDDYTRFTTLEEVVREYVLLVNLRRREGKFHLVVFDLSNNVPFENNPLVLLDGVAIQDVNKFMSFDPLKIKKLEVVNRRYTLGSSEFEGILNWSTYKGDLANYELDSNVAVIDYEGLQLEREFYSPAYNTQEKAASHLPDFRNVLYWQPDITLNGNETKEIGFYTSDVPGKYAVVIQGLDNNGICGSRLVTFEVKK